VKVILDTNVFVAAGFNPTSHSARLIDAVRTGRLRMVWNDATRREIEHILRQIPRLSWERYVDLFREEDRFQGETHPEQFDYVPDPADRKFAALADATGVPLVTSDEDLLQGRARASTPILTPGEFVRRYGV
jgi:predicted nucleic acid-binding protein